MRNSIQLDSVSIDFPGVGTVLNQFSLSVSRGDFLVLYGPSASGKTTILNLIAALLTPRAGKIVWNGSDCPSRIGFVFQNYEQTLFPWFTNRVNIEIPLRVCNSKLGKLERQQRVQEIVRDLKFEIPLDLHPYEMSGGGKQKVALARALVSKPEILLLDEPFNSLDFGDRDFMRGEIVRLWRELGLTIILVTHDLDEALMVGSTLAIIGGKPARLMCPLSLIDLPYPRDAVVARSEDFFKLRANALKVFECAKADFLAESQNCVP